MCSPEKNFREWLAEWKMMISYDLTSSPVNYGRALYLKEHFEDSETQYYC